MLPAQDIQQLYLSWITHLTCKNKFESTNNKQPKKHPKKTKEHKHFHKTHKQNTNHQQPIQFQNSWAVAVRQGWTLLTFQCDSMLICLRNSFFQSPRRCLVFLRPVRPRIKKCENRHIKHHLWCFFLRLPRSLWQLWRSMLPYKLAQLVNGEWESCDCLCVKGSTNAWMKHTPTANINTKPKQPKNQTNQKNTTNTKKQPAINRGNGDLCGSSVKKVGTCSNTVCVKDKRAPTQPWRSRS